MTSWYTFSIFCVRFQFNSIQLCQAFILSTSYQHSFNWKSLFPFINYLKLKVIRSNWYEFDRPSFINYSKLKIINEKGMIFQDFSNGIYALNPNYSCIHTNADILEKHFRYVYVFLVTWCFNFPHKKNLVMFFMS